MKDSYVVSFDLVEDDVPSKLPVTALKQPTFTIDLDGLFSEHLSNSGSFDIKSRIWASTFGKLTQALPIPVLLVDSDHEIVAANQAWARISPYYRKLHGAGFLDLFHRSNTRKDAQESLRQVFITRRPREMESVVEIGGARIWARMTFRSIRIQRKRFVLVVFENLSAERSKLALERRLRDQIEKAKREWERTFDSIPELIMILDRERKILRANRPLAEKLGVSVQEMVGKPCYHYMHGSDAPPDLCPFHHVAANGKPYSLEATYEKLDGDYEVTVSPIMDRQGDLYGVVHVSRDVTARRRAERERQQLLSYLTKAKEELAYRVAHDALTGLSSRPAILGELQKELARSARENSPVGVILIDVDHFKQINDEYGHLAGDAVLRAIAARIKISMRPYDTVGRYGGEEFIVVVPGCDSTKVRTMAERLRRRFNDGPVRTSEGDFGVTLSLGACVVPGGCTTDVNSVIRNVDEALYRAKEAGRNRVEFAAGRSAH
ncbi:MAG: sensor domain-containing diguanylate cyclase [Desulfomonilaceae bacterium]|nr:sensor domain-containing diguanylate cyclase [Desulfomonilaceae bacterium]